MGKQIKVPIIKIWVLWKVALSDAEDHNFWPLNRACIVDLPFSDAEDHTFWPLNRACIVDLPFLRTLLEIRQKSQESSFWEVMDSFLLLAYVSLAASRTLLQQLLACLKFTLNWEDLFCWYKQKNNSTNYGSSTSRTMEMSKAQLVTYNEVYIHQLQPEVTCNIQ